MGIRPKRNPLCSDSNSEYIGVRAPPWMVDKTLPWMSRFYPMSYISTGYFSKPLLRFRYSTFKDGRTATAFSVFYLLMTRLIVPYFVGSSFRGLATSISTSSTIDLSEGSSNDPWKIIQQPWAYLSPIVEIAILFWLIIYFLIGTLCVEVYPRGLIRVTYGGTISVFGNSVSSKGFIRSLRCIACGIILKSSSLVEFIVGDRVTEIENTADPRDDNSLWMSVPRQRRYIEFKLRGATKDDKLPILIDDWGGRNATDFGSITLPIPADGLVTFMYLVIHSISNNGRLWTEDHVQRVETNLKLLGLQTVN